jgi:hypothetical protein
MADGGANAQQTLLYGINSICPATISQPPSPGSNANSTYPVDIYGSNLTANAASNLAVPLTRILPPGTSSVDRAKSYPSTAVDAGHVRAGIGFTQLTAGEHIIDLIPPQIPPQSEPTPAPIPLGTYSNTAVLTVLGPPTITSVSPAAVTAGAPFTLTVDGSNFIPAAPNPVAPTCPANSALTLNSQTVSNAVIQSSTRITAQIPQGALAAGQATVSVTNNSTAKTGFVASNSATFIVNPAPAIDSPSTPTLPTGIIGLSYPTTQITATGGTEPFSWTVSPSDIGLSITGTGRVATLSGTPTSAVTQGVQTVVVTATDAFQVVSQRHYQVTVLPPPSVTLSLPPTITPGGDAVPVTITGPNDFPLPITGTLELTFEASPDLKANTATQDDTLKLSSTTFTIPGPPVALSSGSAAGTIRVAVASLNIGDISAATEGITPATTEIPAAPPVIQTCTLTRTTFGFHTRIAGFSSTREVTKATFTLTPAAGKRLDTNTVARTDAGPALFGPYYNAFTQCFFYDQDLIVSGAATDIAGIAVSLDNAKGTSTTVNCQ